MAIGVVSLTLPSSRKMPCSRSGEAGALAGAPAAPRHRDAADDAKIQRGHVLESDRFAMRHEALRRRGGLEIHALGGELVGIDAQIGKALGEIGDRRKQQLAVIKRAKAQRNLRRVGIAFDDARGLPGVEFRQAFGGRIGADEIGDMVESRTDIDAIVDQRPPHLGAHDVLCAIAPHPSRLPVRAVGHAPSAVAHAVPATEAPDGPSFTPAPRRERKAGSSSRRSRPGRGSSRLPPP